MKRGIKCFSQLLRGKTVALVGNAQSLLEKAHGHDIDSCEIVIRMNKGFIVDSNAQGKETHVLATSIPISTDQVQREFSPKIVLWATPKRRDVPPIYCSSEFDFTLHPRLIWFLLRLKLRARPSTGAIVANFIAGYCQPKAVKVFGFDHFRSKTFYETRSDIGPHEPTRESEFFEKLYERGGFIDFNHNSSRG